MDGWLKGLVALTCVALLVAISVWGWSQWQGSEWQAAREQAADAEEQARVDRILDEWAAEAD